MYIMIWEIKIIFYKLEKFHNQKYCVNFFNTSATHMYKPPIIGLYREYAIAIQDEVGDSNGGNV